MEELLFRGHRDIVDADLADFFGSIPHAELTRSVARRIVYRRVLHLIKMWLGCALEETDDEGRRRRTTEAVHGTAEGRLWVEGGNPIAYYGVTALGATSTFDRELPKVRFRYT